MLAQSDIAELVLAFREILVVRFAHENGWAGGLCCIIIAVIFYVGTLAS